MFQELNISNVLFFLLTVNPFDEYNNFRQLKVSSKDTRTIFLLLTLIRFLTSWGATYLNSSE